MVLLSVVIVSTVQYSQIGCLSGSLNCLPTDDLVLDPFTGSGTTLSIASTLNRNAIGIELFQPYWLKLQKRFATKTNVELKLHPYSLAYCLNW